MFFVRMSGVTSVKGGRLSRGLLTVMSQESPPVVTPTADAEST
jgi:hypothetical protein